MDTNDDSPKRLYDLLSLALSMQLVCEVLFTVPWPGNTRPDLFVSLENGLDDLFLRRIIESTPICRAVDNQKNGTQKEWKDRAVELVISKLEDCLNSAWQCVRELYNLDMMDQLEFLVPTNWFPDGREKVPNILFQLLLWYSPLPLLLLER